MEKKMRQNQILTTEKVYVTPELKRKKKFYHFEFFLSVFLVCLLFSFYIYAEYDKSKNEEIGEQILSNANLYIAENANTEDTTTIGNKSEVWLIVMDSANSRSNHTVIAEPEPEPQALNRLPQDISYSEGLPYYTVATLVIPKLDKNFAILSRTSDALLKISPTKFWGPEPNEVGNFCIVGHNYHNTKFFSKVPDLSYGDTISLTDSYGRTINYYLYEKYVVEADDVSCTSQRTDGKREVTLITCTWDNKQRVVTKFREM